jgi:hypothetical protein
MHLCIYIYISCTSIYPGCSFTKSCMVGIRLPVTAISVFFLDMNGEFTCISDIYRDQTYACSSKSTGSSICFIYLLVHMSIICYTFGLVMHLFGASIDIKGRFQLERFKHYCKQLCCHFLVECFDHFVGFSFDLSPILKAPHSKLIDRGAIW